MLREKPIRVGCVGGGQLGRMMALEAPRLNIQMTFLDNGGSESPAAQVVGATNVIKGKLDDGAKLHQLAKDCDVVTVEIEHVGVESLSELEEEGVNVQPSPRVIRIIQDKYSQKEFFANHGVPLASFVKIDSVGDIHEAAKRFGLPLMLKSRKGAYDGRGNAVLPEASESAIQTALSDLGRSSEEALDLYAEQWVDFHCEVAVMVVRSISGETLAYPAVNAIQRDSICHVVIAPARNITLKQRHSAEATASAAVSSLGDGATGMFGVELFITKDGDVLLNEVAPRPHNTGHYTQDACVVNQFENHLRAVTGMRIGDTQMIVGAAAMVNVLGAPNSTTESTLQTVNAAMSIPRVVVHWYGKSHKPNRKLGHINLTAHSSGELLSPLSQLLKLLDISPVLQTPSPLVAVIMGSTSDLPTMQAAVNILEQFQIPYEVDIVSAHRTPDKLLQYARSAPNRGIQVIIAGAGGAAHLPGMVAAATPVPVIGVPIKTSTLNGQDSLLSIVQMPRGIPVATVAIGNAMNAALLAVRILGSSRDDLREKMEEYQVEMKEKVDMQSEEILRIGSAKYLEGMDNKNTSVNV